MIGTRLFTLQMLVRFSDCDPLGHVNNAAYLTYIEQARIILWREQLGFSSRRFVGGGPRGEGFILARAEVDFRAQARDGDRLEVGLGLAGFGNTSATYEYEVLDLADRRLIAEARTVQVWFDYDAARPVPLTDPVKAKLSSPIGDMTIL